MSKGGLLFATGTDGVGDVEGKASWRAIQPVAAPPRVPRAAPARKVRRVHRGAGSDCSADMSRFPVLSSDRQLACPTKSPHQFENRASRAGRAGKAVGR